MTSVIGLLNNILLKARLCSRIKNKTALRLCKAVNLSKSRQKSPDNGDSVRVTPKIPLRNGFLFRIKIYARVGKRFPVGVGIVFLLFRELPPKQSF